MDSIDSMLLGMAVGIAVEDYIPERGIVIIGAGGDAAGKAWLDRSICKDHSVVIVTGPSGIDSFESFKEMPVMEEFKPISYQKLKMHKLIDHFEKDLEKERKNFNKNGYRKKRK
jgi:hypothetical protein